MPYHAPMKLDIDHVTRILAETAEAVVLPRHRALSDAEVRTKSGPRDLVTIADEEAEARLTARLTALLPGSVTVGEEAASAEPALFQRLAASSTPTWIIDPIDGTWNFAHGGERFCMMVALCRDDVVLASWIYEPLPARVTVAERGSGTLRGGQRVTIPAPPAEAAQQRGFVYHRAVNNGADPRLNRWGSAGIEYLEMLDGGAHFSCYDRAMPWDHAPGSLLIIEAGGHHAFVDSDRYFPSGGPYRPVMAAARPALWPATRAQLLP